MCPQKGDLATDVHNVLVLPIILVIIMLLEPPVAIMVAFHKHWIAIKSQTEQQKARTNELQRARRAKKKAEAEAAANKAKKKAKN